MPAVYDAVISLDHELLLRVLREGHHVDEPGMSTLPNDVRFEKTWTPLYALVVDKTWNENKPSILQTLLEYGASTEILCVTPSRFQGDRCRRGTTALVELVSNYYEDNEICRNQMISCLIGYGANVDECNRDGESILEVASGRGNLQLVEVLIDNGVSATSYDTALQSAAFHGRVDVARCLVRHGASTVYRNKSGYTAGDFARMSSDFFFRRDAQDFGAELDNVPEVRRLERLEGLNRIAIAYDDIDRGHGLSFRDVPRDALRIILDELEKRDNQ